MKYFTEESTAFEDSDGEEFFPSGSRPLAFRCFTPGAPTSSAIVRVKVYGASSLLSYSTHFSSIKNGARISLKDVVPALPTTLGAEPTATGHWAVSVELPAGGVGCSLILYSAA